MVSAGNTGAAMASALFRMGRLAGVSPPGDRRAAADPVGREPDGAHRRRGERRLPSGVARPVRPDGVGLRHQRATASPTPRSRCCRTARRPRRAARSSKRPTPCSPGGPACGSSATSRDHDLLAGGVDVVVVDGFTGNVALKSLEGALNAFMGILGQVFAESPENKAAGDVIVPSLLKYASYVDPEETGGALLLGVEGVCIISHGSSSARGDRQRRPHRRRPSWPPTSSDRSAPAVSR